MSSERAPRGIDPTKAHPARRYNYWLGGKDNFAADRESAEIVASGFPTIRLSALENRKFLQRAVRHLAAEAGIRQFLDIGAGLPSAGNVHEVAQDVAPESRVVYVDNDPIVLVHARALLNSSPEGATAYVDADLREPEKILNAPELTETLDLSRPTALILVATMHFITEDEDAYGLLGRLREALAPGSHIAMTHATLDYLPEERRAGVIENDEKSGVPFQMRTRTEFTRFFDGLELVEPGVTSVVEWRPDDPPGERPTVEDVSMYGAVARVP
ncbi:SAM-dependent methyltransferase [Actinocorallia libanotica]|uniref:SAM-dependent methyltransferase n=1 Tax=Actinocorallia libanotica TaxID=46162 RepID=A0ABP4CEW8_9ACTN